MVYEIMVYETLRDLIMFRPLHDTAYKLAFIMATMMMVETTVETMVMMTVMDTMMMVRTIAMMIMIVINQAILYVTTIGQPGIGIHMSRTMRSIDANLSIRKILIMGN